MTAAVYTIRIVNYLGDYDDLNLVNIVGPYPTAAARNTDLTRLANLPGVYGSLEFLASQIPVEAATGWRVQPTRVADATDLDTLVDVLCGSPDAADPNQTALPL